MTRRIACRVNSQGVKICPALKRLRKQWAISLLKTRGVRQKTVAYIVGTSTSVISRWKSEQRPTNGEQSC